MAELVIVHIVEVRQLRQRGPLLHQVPTARRLANRLQDDLGGEGWEIHALGSGQRDGFTCPSHVLDLIQGIGCIRPFAFAARPTGFPSMARRLHLYISAIPDWEYVSAYASKASAYSVASRLCTLQCRAAETPPETDVDASNPRPGAAAGSLSHGQSARSCRTNLKKVRKTFNRTTSVEQSGVHTTTEGPRNGRRDGRRRVQGTLRPHAPPGRASGGRP